MALTATIVLTVPDLPDADVWFANNAAWSNYWKDVSAEVEFDPIPTTIFLPPIVDETQPIYDMVIDGVDYNVPSNALFQSLLTAFKTLLTSYENLRSELKDAGLITDAQ